MESTPTKKFTVDEGGNKRQEISVDDIKQALNDINQWFKYNASSYYTTQLEDNKGNQEPEVDSIMKKHGADGCSALKALLLRFRGGFQLLDTYKTLTLDDINGEVLSYNLQSQRLFPIAKDIDGQLLCVRVESGNDNLLVYNPEGNSVEEDLKKPLGQYIEEQRDGLLSKKLLYEDELGIVSVQ
ncbi:UNKNOWN [Stylonychia lemnae]|uniref:Uncharacterized protein n=1 Tax=Stylonychia lemnae TaxID=5949 RepID=A0A078A3D3_STYLE|nr:UNKNOWN [Stylonychia lemnae]|eukprot:CDW76788.1 UNKNOWN [Stylonychia lemnae]